MIKNFTSTIDWLKHKDLFFKNFESFNKNKAMIFDYQNKIEEILSKHTNTKYCILTSCGTKSLVLALKCIGVKKNDEVITTPLTFIATVNAIRLVGATPVFVDIKKDTWNIDENKIEEKITNKTKAILSVDWFGNPCNYDKILEIAKKHNLKIVNDCCQSFLSKYNDIPIGSFGDISCFSVGGTKPFCSISEGGFLVTNNKEYINKIKSFSNINDAFDINVIYENMSIFEIVYLYSKINEIDNILQWKNNIANIYKKMKNVVWQEQEPNSTSVWCYMQGLFTDKRNVEIAKKYFQLSTLYQKTICDNTLYKNYQDDVPIAEYISHNSFGLPIYPYINEKILQDAVNKYNNEV